MKNKMDTLVYVCNVLRQVDDSYTLLQNLKDKPGDLDIMKLELARVTGILQALSNKIQNNRQEFGDYEYVLAPIRYFLENHEFSREIQTMSMLYSADPMRLKNLRLTVLDALEEKNLIAHIKAILRGEKS